MCVCVSFVNAIYVRVRIPTQKRTSRTRAHNNKCITQRRAKVMVHMCYLFRREVRWRTVIATFMHLCVLFNVIQHLCLLLYTTYTSYAHDAWYRHTHHWHRWTITHAPLSTHYRSYACCCLCCCSLTVYIICSLYVYRSKRVLCASDNQHSCTRATDWADGVLAAASVLCSCGVILCLYMRRRWYTFHFPSLELCVVQPSPT